MGFAAVVNPPRLPGTLLPRLLCVRVIRDSRNSRGSRRFAEVQPRRTELEIRIAVDLVECSSDRVDSGGFRDFVELGRLTIIRRWADGVSFFLRSFRA